MSGGTTQMPCVVLGTGMIYRGAGGPAAEVTFAFVMLPFYLLLVLETDPSQATTLFVLSCSRLW